MSRDYRIHPAYKDPQGQFNHGPLVSHALGKCDKCGDTLVVDPLPHRCDVANLIWEQRDRRCVDLS